MWHVANLFQKWFSIIKQLLSLNEGDMTICSPSTGYIALGLRPRAILPASGEQIVMSPSLKGNNCILLYLINIHWLIVVFDWSRAGHAEGAILSCCMIILPSDVISVLKSARALVATWFCLQCTRRVLFYHVA